MTQTTQTITLDQFHNLLAELTDDELATLNEDKFASALITLHH